MAHLSFQILYKLSEPSKIGFNNADELEFATIEAMDKYGGSFVVSLAECYRHADWSNRQTLMNSFPQYFTQYMSIAIQQKIE